MKIATSYLACMCISWSCTFWVVKGQGHPSRLKVNKNQSKRRRRGHSVSDKHISCLFTYKVLSFWNFNGCFISSRARTPLRVKKICLTYCLKGAILSLNFTFLLVYAINFPFWVCLFKTYSDCSYYQGLELYRFQPVERFRPSWASCSFF